MNDREIRRWEYNQVVQAVQLLAADYETQIQVLPDFVHVPDEVVLEFSNSLPLARYLLEDGIIDQAQYEKLHELDRAIDDVVEQLPKGSEYPEMLAQLRSHTAWDELRVRARETLVVLGIEQQRPDLGYNVYLPGSSSTKSS